jgi:hypothetical protein
MKILRFFAVLCLFFSLFGSVQAQNSAPPPVKNYQEYLLMMKAVNDASKERGMAPVKPLSHKEWERLRAPNSSSTKEPDNSKSERLKYANFMGGKTSGKDATTLILYDKITPELQRHYSSDNYMISAWRDMGFRKVIFKDGKRSWARNF